MISLTDEAIEKVRATISAQETPDEYVGVRVAVVGGGCSGFQYSMNLEKNQKDGDHVVHVDGFKVLVDEQSSLYLQGTEIDYVETQQGAGFKFNNPNVQSTCGCGDSFNV